jgi:hypothetical protein
MVPPRLPSGDYELTLRSRTALVNKGVNINFKPL